MKDPIPYLRELDSNPDYEVIALIPKDFQLMDPNDQYDSSNTPFFDTENKNIIVKGKRKLSEDRADFIALKINPIGSTERVQSIFNIINNGYFFYGDQYSSWIIDNDSTLKDFKPLLSQNERNDMDKWLPKFQEAYNKADYVYITGLDHYFIFLDDTWYIMKFGSEGQDYEFAKKYPAKNPPGRMTILKDITPDFLEKDYDNSLIELLGYGQEYFEKGKGMNPISGSAGHYYFALKMKKDTLKFKRFGTMHPNLWVYKIPEELGGHPDVVFVVQEYNRMFPNMEFGGMYVIRPRGLAEKDSLTIEK